MNGRLKRPHIKGNLEMVKYCVANECPVDEDVRCLHASNTYTKKSKRLGIRNCRIWRLKMVIFTYSNILLT